jgi:hypothetical protein
MEVEVLQVSISLSGYSTGCFFGPVNSLQGPANTRRRDEDIKLVL